MKEGQKELASEEGGRGGRELLTSEEGKVEGKKGVKEGGMEGGGEGRESRGREL